LGVVFGQSEDEVHAALQEAVRAGLILRLEDSYAFLHDRIQEAAYALIPENERAEVHLRIGRVLLASLTEIVSLNTIRRRCQTGHSADHAGVEDQGIEDQQESSQRTRSTEGQVADLARVAPPFARVIVRGPPI
jgi:hypothetical protein